MGIHGIRLALIRIKFAKQKPIKKQANEREVEKEGG